MQRLYITKITGTGTNDDPYRSVWLDIIKATNVFVGTVQSATAMIVNLDPSASDIDGAYAGNRIIIGIEEKHIVDYIGASRQAVIGSPWESIPTLGTPARIHMKAPPLIGNAIDSERHNFWIGQLDTDDAQHVALIADSSVRYVSQSLLSSTIQSLTQNQRDAIIEVFTWLGFPTDIFSGNAKVKDVMFYLVGRICWHPVRQAAEAL